MSESKGPMTRFSILLACLLLLSLPFKLGYFQDGITAEGEIQERQYLIDGLAAHLASQGFEVIPAPVDVFMPNVVLQNDSCTLSITPLPVNTDLDDAFVFENAAFGGDLTYYYDGSYYTDPPVNSPRFWVYANQVMLKVGISVRDRIRLGIAHSEGCDLQSLNLDQADVG